MFRKFLDKATDALQEAADTVMPPLIVVGSAFAIAATVGAAITAVGVGYQFGCSLVNHLAPYIR